MAVARVIVRPKSAQPVLRAAMDFEREPMSSEGSHGSSWVEDVGDVDRATTMDCRVRQPGDVVATVSGVDGRRLAEALARVMSPDVLADADAWQECTARAVRDLVS